MEMGTTLEVRASVLNVRDKPGFAGKVITRLNRGDLVTVHGITMKDGYEWHTDGGEGWFAVSRLADGRRYAGNPLPTTKFKVMAWPTEIISINEGNPFGGHPEIYNKFGLPGHEGLDIRAPLGSKILSVATGYVREIIRGEYPDGRPHPYGFHVRVQHTRDVLAIYAHCQPDFPLVIGQDVAPGTLLGRSGNTGNSTGPHLHFTLKDSGQALEGWPGGIVDPTPFFNDYLEE